MKTNCTANHQDNLFWLIRIKGAIVWRRLAICCFCSCLTCIFWQLCCEADDGALFFQTMNTWGRGTWKVKKRQGLWCWMWSHVMHRLDFSCSVKLEKNLLLWWDFLYCKKRKTILFPACICLCEFCFTVKDVEAFQLSYLQNIPLYYHSCHCVLPSFTFHVSLHVACVHVCTRSMCKYKHNWWRDRCRDRLQRAPQYYHHHMLRIWVVLSGRDATGFHPGPGSQHSEVQDTLSETFCMYTVLTVQLF